MAKIKQKAGRKKIDPTKVKKNVAVYITQQKIDEHGGIDSLKEKINFFIDNMNIIKLDSGTRRNAITMQLFSPSRIDDDYVSGNYHNSETEIKIPTNIFETFFR